MTIWIRNGVRIVLEKIVAYNLANPSEGEKMNRVLIQLEGVPNFSLYPSKEETPEQIMLDLDMQLALLNDKTKAQ